MRPFEEDIAELISIFVSSSLSFLILEPILEILEELSWSFNQVCPNFLRHLLALLVRAREFYIGIRGSLFESGPT